MSTERSEEISTERSEQKNGGIRKPTASIQADPTTTQPSSLGFNPKKPPPPPTPLPPHELGCGMVTEQIYPHSRNPTC